MAEDVVGLRFVSENAERVIREIDRYGQATNRAREITQRMAANRGLDTFLKNNQERFRALNQIMRESSGPVTQFDARLKRLGTTAQSTGQVMRSTTTITDGMRNQFLATANTIAILDGPLGGIASRFSAFGVLLGRTGFLLAGVAVSMTALFTVVGKGIASFARFEAQSARINAVLEATGNQVGKTGKDIEALAASIALATLESEQGVRAAAGQLLTFRNVAGDAFEATLRSATDLAAVGFGTVESATKQLAKALQDPRQGLTSLSRAGVTFTRQQRELIISLVDTGQQAEAMERVLRNVNQQVGGAGAAAARDTMAGQFDTIAQAASKAAREIGGAVAETEGFETLLGFLARQAAAFADEPTGQDRIDGLREQLDRLLQVEADIRESLSKEGKSFAEQRFGEFFSFVTGAKSELEAVRRLIDTVRAELDEATTTQQASRIAPILGESRNRRAGVADVEFEVKTLEKRLGLTQEQIRVQKKLAEAGLAFERSDIPGILENTAARLREAGVEGIKFERMMDQARQALEDGADAGDDLRRAFEQLSLFSELDQSARALARQNEILAAQIPLIREGVSATEARQQAQTQIERAIAEEVAANESNTQAVRDAAQAKLDALDAAERLTDEEHRATNEANALAMAAERVASRIEDAGNAALGLFQNLRNAMRELEATEAGIAAGQRAAARGGSERDIRVTQAAAEEEARLRAQGFEGAELQGAVATAAANERRRLEAQAAEDALFEPFKASKAGGGGSSSSRAAEQVKTLKGVTQELERQINVRIKLAQASDKERLVLETISEITDRLDEQGANYTDEEIRRAAERIAKREEEAERADRVREANERVQQSAEDAFTSFITGAEGARDAIDNMLNSLLNLLAQEVSGSIFDGLLGGTSFGDAISSGIGSLFGGGSSTSAPLAGQPMFDIAGSFAGGGYTGPGPRSGGLDGKGGFVAMLHPQETIVDHTKGRGQGGQVVNNIQVIAPPGSDVQEERQQNGSGGEDLTILIDQAVSGLARDPSSRLSRTLNTGFGISPTRRSR